MALEIEAKMKVPNLAPVRARLEALGAARGRRIFEINRFFDTPAHDLLAHDQGLRLRTNRDVDTGQQTHVYTYKGARRPGALKSRPEIEVVVDDPEQAEQFLAALGYEKTLSFEKRREKWKLEGCSIELDEMPLLGAFVEVEGPDEAVIQRVRQSLGLANSPAITDSYIAMLAERLRQDGRDDRAVSF